MAANIKQPQLLTRTEAAKYLNVSKGTLEVWASTKRYPLPFIKIGASVRYRLSDLDEFIERGTVRPAAI